MRKLLIILISLLFCQSILANISIRPTNHKNIDVVLNKQLKMLIQSQPFKKLQNESLDKANHYLETSLANSLKPYGYFEAKVYFQDNNTLAINLNQRVLFGDISVTIIGEGKNKIQNQLKKIHYPKIEKGQAFSSRRYQKTKEKLLSVAEKNGYIKASFSKSQVLVDLAKHRAKVILIFDTDKRYYFGQLNFSKTRYPQNLLNRYAPFKYHSPYNPNQLIDFEQNLQNSPYFNQVNINPIETDKSIIPLTINLQEAPRLQYLYGGGYGTDTGFRGRAGLTKLFENGHTLQTRLQVSQLENTLQSKYTIPGNIPYEEEANIIANIFNTDYAIGRSDATLFALKKLNNKAHYQIDSGLNILYETYQFSDSTPENGLYLYPSLRYSYFSIDNPLFSKNGYSATLKSFATSKDLLSKASAFQTSFEIRFAKWLDSTHTRIFLKGNVSLTETQNIYQIPISLQELLGGSNNLDAYQYQSIGPGKKLVLGRAELQQETVKDWFITTHYGIGDVYHPGPFSEKRSVGVGLMYASPIGLIKAGVAKGLDLNGRPLRFVFSMGPDL